MTYLVRLPHKHEDLGSDLQHPHEKSDAMVHATVPVLGGQRQEGPWRFLGNFFT